MGLSTLPVRRPPGLQGMQHARQASDATPADLLAIMLEEGRRRIVPLSLLCAGLALLALLAGLFVLPIKYTSKTTILAQESDIIQPLLEGRAVATGVTDRAGIARQVIYSRKVLQGAMQAGGWMEADPTPVEQDKIMEDIRHSTVIRSPRENLIEISFSDSDPERTLKVTEQLAELFMQESLATKERESREAFEFIDSQVSGYHAKLADAEENLQSFRSSNADALPGSAADTNARIGALRNQVEQTRMTLMEQRSREQSLRAQISGESAVTAVQTRENMYRGQLIQLQGQLDTLLLNFTEQHPDVVRIRHQMDDIRSALSAEADRPSTGNNDGLNGDAQMNPLYVELRSQLAQTRREAAATASRLSASESMLAGELARGRRIALSEGDLAELTRDYEVNRDIYQDLLRRRENARVSMDLDKEKRGLTMRVQDPATLPLRPTGLSLMHFVLAGLFAALAIPVALLFLLAKFDPRIRSRKQLQEAVEVPVLASIPAYRTSLARRHEMVQMMTAGAVLTTVVLVYLIVYGVRQLHG